MKTVTTDTLPRSSPQGVSDKSSARAPAPTIWATLTFLAAIFPASFMKANDIVPVHDPSMIKEGDTYYLFSTGHGVPIRTSSDLKKWKVAGRVFEEDLPGWTKDVIPGAVFPWAPDISYFNGRFHVYYSISTFGSQRSVIGLATTKTLDPASPDFGWTDHGEVVDSLPERDGFNAIDADVVLDEHGEPWLSWGSFHWGERHPGGIMILPLEKETGMRKEGVAVKSIAGRPGEGAIEAPAILRRGGYFYLFVSFDYCCRGINSTYKIMVGRSEVVDGPYLDRDGKPMTEGGGTLVLEGDGKRLRGPGHNDVLVEGDTVWMVHHFYDAANKGRPTLQVRSLTWDDEDWPQAAEPEGAEK